MSIYQWNVAKTGRAGSGNNVYTRTYTLPLQLLSNDPNDDARIIRDFVATLFPLGSPYPNDPGAVVQGYRETQGEEWQIWFAEVEFSSRIEIPASFGASGGGGGSGGGGTQAANPLLRSPEISFGVEAFQEAIEEDFESPTPRKVVNSAGDPFLPPVTIERKRLVMTVKVNKQFYEPLDYSDLLGFPTTNDALFLNYFPAGTLHLCDHTADSLQEDAIWYWATMCKFQVKFGGWNPVQILDQGFRELIEGVDFDAGVVNRQKVDIRTANGARLEQPARLNGSGLELASNLPSEFIDFTLFYPRDYSVLL